MQDMADLLDQMEPIKSLRRGDVVEGVVMRADGDGILVNVGHKAEGIVPAGEMRTLSADERAGLKVGDDIVTYVIKGETAEQAAILSVDRAAGLKGWQVLKSALEAGETVTGKIQGFNRGGAIVDVEGVNGFVPMSQLVTVSRGNFAPPPTPVRPEEAPVAEADEADQPEPSVESESGDDAEAQVAEPEAEPGAESEVGEPAQESETDTPAVEPEPETRAEVPREPVESPDIGRELSLKVLELDRGRNRAIFSERKVVQEDRDEHKAKLIEELTIGETRRGKVTGISRFGAFVDLGGADGLIHISELSWEPVRSPEEIVSVGQELDVYVLRVDAENRKIGLSLRRLQQEPWETITDHFHVGDIVDAKVTKLTNFGAFARVERSVEGLIHISELTSAMINHPKEVVAEGDAVRVKILRIEPERRRLGLSLRRADEET